MQPARHPSSAYDFKPALAQLQEEATRPRILPPEPAFPIHALPPAIADWLSESAAVTRVSLALTAPPFLAATGAVIGRQLKLQVGPGWTERPALWVALITLTGFGKTPAIAAIRKPFDTLQVEAWEQGRKTLAAWRKQPEPRPPRPASDRLLVNGGSYHALVRNLGGSTGQLILRDELFGLIGAMDRRAGEDRQHYLSLWSSEPIFPTETDAAPIFDPVVSIVGGIQPALIPKIRRTDQDGFLERFILVLAGGVVPAWDSTLPTPVGESTVTGILRQLRAIPGAAAHKRGLLVELAPEANEAWTIWFTTHLDLVVAGRHHLAGFYRKLPSQLARFALILHALWNPENPAAPLTGDTMKRAIELVEYFRIHIHRTAPLVGIHTPLRTPNEALAERILHAIARTRDSDGWLVRSQLYEKIGRPEIAIIDALLNAYIAHGLVESRIVQTGGRPATYYRIPR